MTTLNISSFDVEREDPSIPAIRQAEEIFSISKTEPITSQAEYHEGDIFEIARAIAFRGNGRRRLRRSAGIL